MDIKRSSKNIDKRKALIFDIQRFSIHDGNGIRTTVFFKGCPLHCYWCHNPEGLVKKPQIAFFNERCNLCQRCSDACKLKLHIFGDGKHIFNRNECILCGECIERCPQNALVRFGDYKTVEDVYDIVARDKAFYADSGGGVTLSGGECLLWADFCAELLKKCKENGISTAIDTCGEVDFVEFEKVLPYCDEFLYDIKAFNIDAHIRATGSSNKRILENFEKLCKTNANIFVRVPFIPTFTEAEISDIKLFVAKMNEKYKRNIKIEILPFHKMGEEKYKSLGLKYKASHLEG